MFFRGRSNKNSNSKSPPKTRTTTTTTTTNNMLPSTPPPPPPVVVAKLYTGTPRSRSSSRDNTTTTSLSSSSTLNSSTSTSSSSTPITSLDIATTIAMSSSLSSQLLPTTSTTSTLLPESPPPLRGRFNSRDLPRSYSGQYASSGTGTGNEGRFPHHSHSHHPHDQYLLVPLECLQQEQFLQAQVSTGVFFCIYLSIIFALQFISTVTIIALSGAWATTGSRTSSTSTAGGGHSNNNSEYDWFWGRLLQFHKQSPPPQPSSPHLLLSQHDHDGMAYPQSLSWTLTNLIHLIFSLMTIHFSKGSFLVVNQQGELNAMTVWEQLEATPESATHMRRSLLIVPTILCYIAIAVVNFEPTITLANLSIWCVAMLPKLSFMNGVRLFGINRTAGIDDDVDDVDFDVWYTEEKTNEQQLPPQQSSSSRQSFHTAFATTCSSPGKPVEGLHHQPNGTTKGHDGSSSSSSSTIAAVAAAAVATKKSQ